ncbi:MAG: methionyl-tRNA formyltransferase [Planctomycetaceae bacterium]|nr:methionyl-tRNA formyltransferase [Planctomycetaceae bacterium]
MSLNVVMMGTGEFALPAFLALCDSGHQVVGLFTQPDRTGRGHHSHQPHPMKEAALERNIPVFQPDNVNTQQSLDELRDLKADVFIVAAYGQILKPELLDIPPLGAFNIHGSLLPKYRGASPIQYAILHGETESGITIFKIEPKLDAGPMIRKDAIPVGPDETAGELHDRLAQLGGEVIVATVDEIESGSLEPLPQTESETVYAPRLKKTDGIIDWTRSAKQIHDHIRAFQPWPKTFTWFQHADQEPQRLLIHKTEVFDQPTPDSPGAIFSADETQVLVATGNGILNIIELQPEGKRRMAASDFMHGHALQPGDRFETPPSQQA